MKLVTFSLGAILAMGSLAHAEGRSDKKRLHQVYPCVGPMSSPNGPRPVGSPRLTIKEYMVKMGPMLPAFKHEYELEVRPQNPTVPSKIFVLQWNQTSNNNFGAVNVYTARDVRERNKVAWTAHHDLGSNNFTVYFGETSALHYVCRLANSGGRR